MLLATILICVKTSRASHMKVQAGRRDRAGGRAGPIDFLGIEKRTEAETENLILVHLDFWTFRRLCHYEITLF